MRFMDLISLKNVTKIERLSLLNIMALRTGSLPSYKADEKSWQRQNESYIRHIADWELKQQRTLSCVRIFIATHTVLTFHCFLYGFHLKIDWKIINGHGSGWVQEIALDGFIDFLMGFRNLVEKAFTELRQRSNFVQCREFSFWCWMMQQLSDIIAVFLINIRKEMKIFSRSTHWKLIFLPFWDIMHC